MMTRVALAGESLGLMMLCKDSANVRLWAQTVVSSRTLDDYYDQIEAHRERFVHMYFLLHLNETISGAWVRVRKDSTDSGACPVLKVGQDGCYVAHTTNLV